jgi:hypothetical protein
VTTVVVAALQVGLAGAAAFGRHCAEGRREQAVERLGEVRRELASATAQVVDAEPMPAPRWSLPEAVDVPGTMQAIQALGDQAGVTIVSVKAAAGSAAGQRSLQLGGRGRPTQVCTFLAAIEAQPSLLVVETGRVLPATADEIAFELGIGLFHAGGAK